MIQFLLMLVLQFPTAPLAGAPKVCTVAGLGLVTTTMSLTTLDALIKAKWGVLGFRRQLKLMNATSTIVEVGFRTLIDGDRDPEKCPSSTCFQNRVGSWRKLWNSILITECQRQNASALN